MEKVTGIFIGYKGFHSDKTNKDYYVLSFVFLVSDDVNARVTYYVKDLFVSQKEYDKFLKENKLVSPVEISREIVNDTVRYYI